MHLHPVTPSKKTALSVEVLQEWDEKLDTMEVLFDACVELDEGCEQQLATVRLLRQQIRELVPFDNNPIITNEQR